VLGECYHCVVVLIRRVDVLTSTSSRRHGSVAEMYANQRHIVLGFLSILRFLKVIRCQVQTWMWSVK